MGTYQGGFWPGSGGTRAARASGVYGAYIPHRLHDLSFALTSDNESLLREAEGAVARMDESLNAPIAGISPLLRGCEAVASSWIEGIVPGAQQIALAGLALDEDIRGVSDSARSVANNLLVIREMARRWTEEPTLRVSDLVAAQSALFPDRPRLHGIRTAQNWIGGSSHNPLTAVFVPPPPEQVERLLVDLLAFAESRAMSPLVQAGILHAQFETIHPFADGNGRVGRALIQATHARRGRHQAVPLPISLVLLTRTDEYMAGLERFRFEGPPTSFEADRAVNGWLDVFLRATVDAAHQAQEIASDVATLRDEWDRRLTQLRQSEGKRAKPRGDAAVLRILDTVTQAPAMTTETAERLLGIGPVPANAAFRELADAGIVTRRSDQARALYVAPDVVEFLDVSQRRLASVHFDTAQTPPSRPVPELPQDRAVAAPTPSFSEAADSVWAKTNKDAGTWMPLTRHLTDSAAVAALLWDQWLAPNVRRVISRGLPNGDLDGRLLVTWLAGVHDIGKASPGFAVKARMTRGYDDLLDRMARHGLTCPPYAVGGGIKLPPHCRIGQAFVTDWLERRHGLHRDIARTYALPVGMHHGVPPTWGELEDLRLRREWTGADVPAWAAVQDELLTVLATITGAEARFAQWSTVPLSPEAQVLVSAVIVVADWLASDDMRFPHQDATPSPERARRARIGHDLRSPLRLRIDDANAEALMRRRFPEVGATPTAVQVEAVRIAREVTEPSLLLIESPTGSGKTEAALLAAEVLAARFGCGGVFVALPTMATSDAMFERVHAWTGHLDTTDPSTIFLAHGKARLNESYRGIGPGARITGINAAEREFGDLDDVREAAIVSSWLNGRRRGVLANIVVGTIDQALFGGLKSRFVALRHLGLAGKVVIVDEVHAADDYMRTYLVRVLEWLGAFGTPVILLSATLPPAQRRELVAAYAKGRQRGVPRQLDAPGYPQITVQNDHTEVRAVPWDGERRQLRIERLQQDCLIRTVTDAVEAGSVVVVVRNTVAAAQETYSSLEAALGDRVTLIHSRFLASDRADRERSLRDQLGPPRPGRERPWGLAVVGTQVLEQSLDIDADLMVTDLAPLDLLLQRAGRLHRHRRGDGEVDRPANSRRPRLLVMGSPDPKYTDPPELDPGSRAVYGESRLLRAAAVLAPHLAGIDICLPDDVPVLVGAAYDPDMPPVPGWRREWERAESDAATRRDQQTRRAKTFLLGGPRASDVLMEWLAGRAGDSENDEKTVGHAQVRDSEDGLEVIVVQQTQGTTRLLPFGTPFPHANLGHVLLSAPPDDLALTAANSTIRLPQAMTTPWLIDRVISELEALGRDFVGWQRSPLLEKQLILPLDDNLEASVAGWHLRYDRDLGLVTTREATP